MKRLSIIFSCLLFSLSVFSQGGNTATGTNALSSNIAGYDNTATGVDALTNNTTGFHNSAHGCGALRDNEVASRNTAIGFQSLNYNDYLGRGYDNENTADGVLGLFDYLGTENTAIGVQQERIINLRGDFNTFIGYYASNQTSNSYRYYTTNIGNGYVYPNSVGTFFTYNYEIRIGNINVGSIGGYVAWSNLSDGRTKKNIRQDVPGLAFINKLHPVTYNFDLDAMDHLLKGGMDVDMRPALSQEEKEARETKEKQLYTGFVAQDVEKAAQSIGYDFSGIDMDEGGVYALRYSEFVMPLVKAVQEFSEQNDALQSQVDKLTELVDRLLKKRASNH